MAPSQVNQDSEFSLNLQKEEEINCEIEELRYENQFFETELKTRDE